MKYKALILDLDGTIIQIKQNGLNSLPSENVRKHINRASKLINICISTGRSYSSSLPIFSFLNITAPSTISNGAQIIDPKSKRIIKEKIINLETAEEIIKKIKFIPFKINDGVNDIQYFEGYKLTKVLSIFTEANIGIIEKLENVLSGFNNIVYYKYPCWKKNKSGLYISNVNSTKKQGVLDIANLLDINSNEIIGVGDGYTDLPMLMACGLKVAMGNAVPELKSIANYVAPNIENDGVVNIINKYVLR